MTSFLLSIIYTANLQQIIFQFYNTIFTYMYNINLIVMLIKY